MPGPFPTIAIGVVLAVCASVWLSGCGKEPTPKVNPPRPAKAAPPAVKPPVASAPQADSVATPAPAPAKPPGAPPAQAVPASSTPAVQPAAVEPPPEQVYTYRRGNRRDPFRSIIVASGKQAETTLMHPLQQYAVKDLRLVAVIWGQLGAGAMLQTPDGKGYTVYIGTSVGNRDGVVKQIKQDQIVVKERYTDIFGERKEESVVLDLHLPEEGLK